MNVSEVLDRTLRFDGVLAGDSDYTRRRLVHLEWLQEASDQFCMERPFGWRMRPVQITIAAQSSAADLPSDFVEIGAQGSLCDNTRRFNLEERSPILIQRLQNQPPRSVHREFAIFERSAATTSDPGAAQIQIGNNSAAQSFTLWYLSAPPILTDVNASNSGLDRIPAAYHFTVLLPKMKAKICYANDSQREMWEAEALRGLNRAIATDGQGRNSTPQALPRATPGMW